MRDRRAVDKQRLEQIFEGAASAEDARFHGATLQSRTSAISS